MKGVGRIGGPPWNTLEHLEHIFMGVFVGWAMSPYKAGSRATKCSEMRRLQQFSRIIIGSAAPRSLRRAGIHEECRGIRRFAPVGAAAVRSSDDLRGRRT